MQLASVTLVQLAELFGRFPGGKSNPGSKLFEARADVCRPVLRGGNIGYLRGMIPVLLQICLVDLLEHRAACDKNFP
jgi:hypothetical protein